MTTHITSPAVPSGGPSTGPWMRAVVVAEGSAGTTVTLTERPVPVPTTDQVLVRVIATTVISSELATIASVSMADLPLVLGNDFVGVVVAAPGGQVQPGIRVVGGYGGYGYTRDGAWADYVCVDADDVFAVDSELDSVQLAAMPGSFTAASGGLHSLGPLDGRTLLVRGGTSGVGLAATTLAIALGAEVVTTTRQAGKIARLLDHGARHALVDDAHLGRILRVRYPDGVDCALEVLGLRGLPTTMACLKPYGVACLTGLLEDQRMSGQIHRREDRADWAFPHPMEIIPPTTRLTVGGVAGTPRSAAMVQDWADGLTSGRLRMPIDSVFGLEEIDRARVRRADPSTFGKVILRVSEEPTAPSPDAGALDHHTSA